MRRRGGQYPDDVQLSRDSAAFEWASVGLHSMFCHPRRVSNIMRFNACASRVLDEKYDLSSVEYLQSEGYSSRFRDDYLIVSFCSRPEPPISHWLWCTLYDGRGVGYPTRCVRHGLPSQNPWFDSGGIGWGLVAF